MKFLILNNSGKEIKNLKSFLLKYGLVDTIDFRDLTSPLLDLSKYDCLVLSGSSMYSVMYLENNFDKEKEIILNSKLPIIGICFGAQLIANVYGNVLNKHIEKIKGIFTIEYLSEKYKVWENHNWTLNSNEGLTVLGKSVFGIEVFKVNNKSIYGLQFHPENPHKNNFGYLVFEDILKRVVTK